MAVRQGNEPILLRGFLSAVASSPLVGENCKEGSEALNALIQDARELAGVLGISWSEPENDD
jgi:hypothetical protein